MTASDVSFQNYSLLARNPHTHTWTRFHGWSPRPAAVPPRTPPAPRGCDTHRAGAQAEEERLGAIADQERQERERQEMEEEERRLAEEKRQWLEVPFQGKWRMGF